MLIVLAVHFLLPLQLASAQQSGAQIRTSIASLSTIRDVIYNPDDRQPFNGTITIEPQHFARSSPPTLVVPVVDGMFSVTLLPVDMDSSPSAVYSATFAPRGSGSRWVEIWHVSRSSRLSLSDVRVSQLTTASHGSADPELNSDRAVALPIPITDVAGLSNALNSVINSLTILSSTAASITASVGAIQNAQLIRGEVPNGVINGTNASFTLANPPNPGTLSVSLNGTKLAANRDFSVSGTSLVLATGAVPSVGDLLSADYAIPSPAASSLVSGKFRSITLPIPMSGVSGLSSALNQIGSNLTTLNQEFATANAALAALNCRKLTVGELPSGAINGVNTTFSVSSATAVASTIAVYLNGMRLSPGADYALNQAAIVFLPSSVPQSGDLVAADYCSQ